MNNVDYQHSDNPIATNPSFGLLPDPVRTELLGAHTPEQVSRATTCGAITLVISLGISAVATAVAFAVGLSE